jgi:hypothetical protein
MPRYSIKPGRGPSAFGAVGAVVVAAFGVLWTIFAIWLTADAPWPIVRIIFPAFGVLFVVMAIAGAFYNTHNATQSNRFSTFDVVPTDSEPEPMLGRDPAPPEERPNRFCTQCGGGLRPNDKFCGRCGTRVST